MAKRMQAEAKGRSSKKSTTGGQMPEEMKAEASLSPDVAGDMMDDEEVADEQQPQEQSDGANVEQEPHNDDEVTKLKEEIEANKIEIAKNQKRIDNIEGIIEEIDAIVAAWNDDTLRTALLSKSCVPVADIVVLFPSLKDQRVELAKERRKQTSRVERLERKEERLIEENKELELKIEKLVVDDRFLQLPPSESKNHLSGLVYIEETYRIGIYGQPDSNIGLNTMSENKPKRKNNHDLATLDISSMVQEAESVLAIDIKDPKFLDKLLEKVPALDKNFVGNAWNSLRDEYKLMKRSGLGEMFFQQCICAPFSKLLMAAGGGDASSHREYRTDQNVKSSMSVMRKARESGSSGEVRMLSMHPDAAATLNDGWDAFGVMEIKPQEPCNDRYHLLDNDKCVLMTAVTAMVIKQCITKKDYRKVRIPFIVVCGSESALYVTALDKDGFPEVLYVRSFDIFTSPSPARKELFVFFALLLNGFKVFFKNTAKAEYTKSEKARVDAVSGFTSYSIASRSKGNTSSRNDQEGNQPAAGQGLPDRARNEECAKEAAQYGGKFLDLKDPFVKCLSLTDNDPHVHQQSRSPFFFRGRSTFSSTLGVASNQEAFLKVWKTDDVDTGSVHSEWMHYDRAYKAGVPVPTPLLSGLAHSTCSCGFEYLVLAMEFIHTDYRNIKTIGELWRFCMSLIKAVLALHQKAKLLHCDLKPENLRWSKGVVRLIDFGHAQDIDKPVWIPGTEGYEAPEVLDEMPCSAKTDAFSVGIIISETMGGCISNAKQNMSHRTQILHEISFKLTESDPSQRWSLDCALQKMQSNSMPVNEKETLYVEVNRVAQTLHA